MVNWDGKYSTADGLLYGDKPSGIIDLATDRFPDRLGHILCLGDGEGRQSRALAERGFNVTAIDFSEVATNRARQQDQKRGLAVNRLIGNAAQPPEPEMAIDSCFLCFLHFSVAERQACFRWLKQALPLSGLLFLEGFGPDQPHYRAKYMSGGPEQADLLYDTTILKDELAEFTVHHQFCAEVILDDGPGHQGLAQITQMICEKVR